MKHADLIIKNAAQLVTVAGGSSTPRRGKELADIGVIPNGCLVVTGETIAAVGGPEILSAFIIDDDTQVIDASGRCVLPGLIDPHTHLVWAGSREHELTLKLQGVPYLEILERGGGILATVDRVRRASKEELYAKGKANLNAMLLHGTTTAEAKSGYGLTTDSEIKTLQVIRDLNLTHPVDIVPTFLGAHAIPKEYRGNPDAYLDLVIAEMLPAVAAQNLAEFCDVFCEQGVFTPEQSRRVLEEALKLGLKPKLHGDEVVDLGGAALAASLGAVSADHLSHSSPEGIAALAASNTIAVLLPGTTFSLMSFDFADAQQFINAGAAVALASDCNPGSCPTPNLQLIMTLACLRLKMTPPQVITAVTINAAHAVGRAHQVGSLEQGKLADILITTAPNLDYLLYHFGTNQADTVIKRGKVVVQSGCLVANN